MKYIQNITLDVSENLEYKYINAKQGDNATRYLNITLTENNEKIIPESGYVASFRCLKPDGHSCIDTGVINKDGTITVELTNQVLAVEGTTQADISLSNGSSVLSAASFYIQVGSAPISSNQTASSNDFLLLIQKTTEAVEAINTIEETVNNAKEALEGVEEIKAYIGYTDNDILGLQVDFENKKFTRLAGAVGKNAGTDFDGFAMYGGRKRCNVMDDGTINAYYGDTNYTDDGTNGQVMVYQPKFYYKVVPLKLEKNIATGIGYHIRKANYYASDTPKAGFKPHPAFYDENGNEVEYILYSAYEGVLKKASDTGYYNDAQSTNSELNTEADLICSVSSQKPISGQNIALKIANAEKLCSNRGNGWHCEMIKTLSANQLLMMIEYGALNMQAAIGQGVCRLSDVSGKNCACNTGATRTLGNVTGNATATFNITNGVETTYREEGFLSLSYRGVENPYGNIALMIEGINYKGDKNGVNRVYIADDFNFDVNKTDGNYHSPELTVANNYGYINAFGYDEKYDWLFMPSEIGGTSALPVGDRLAVVPNSTVNKILLNGGIWKQATYCGAFQIDLQTNYNQAMRMNGCRLVYIPAAD